MSAHKTPVIEIHGSVKVWHPQDGDGGYSISFKSGGWMPGCFDSVDSAIRGGECCFIDESKFVLEIQQPINHFDKGNRLITIEDMINFK